ncbi:MAG: hypothetical protein IMF08_01235 [Proteobacteria bacterium]|nr:hypothetical protein [Pseudomonadota bacterium]
MRVLVIGAGASVAEAIRLDIVDDFRPPVVSNFTSKLWKEFNPHPVLDMFLESMGYEVLDRDGRELFYELERDGKTDVEQFFAFAWRHRRKNWAPRQSSDPMDPSALPKDYIHGFAITSDAKNTVTFGAGKPLLSWENLIYHGIGNPLQFLLLQGFHVNGKGWKPLTVSQEVGAKLRPGDVVVSLNYDPLFEIGLNQAGLAFQYAVRDFSRGTVCVCKPHGTLNMAISEDGTKAAFGNPEHLAAPPPTGWRSFLGIIPPRFEKVYEEHPLANSIVSTLMDIEPSIVTYWGVGLTTSDVDLLDLYRAWTRKMDTVEVLNPDKTIAEKYRSALGVNVRHFSTHEPWLAQDD